jgi:hypothetical protein
MFTLLLAVIDFGKYLKSRVEGLLNLSPELVPWGDFSDLSSDEEWEFHWGAGNWQDIWWDDDLNSSNGDSGLDVSVF